MSADGAGGGGGGVTMTWEDELASLVDSGIRYADGSGGGSPERSVKDLRARVVGPGYEEEMTEESVKDQVKGFLKASGELLGELGRGCRDIVKQSLVGVEDTYLVMKIRGTWAVVSDRLKFLNEYLPEDKDPAHAWPVVILVFLLTLTVLGVNSGGQSSVEVKLPKKLYIQPPSATRIQLPDGRYMAYQEQGVPAEIARFSLVAPHSFLSSRLAGIPGIKASLLEEFGVRLLTYDLPGFGESDAHPERTLNSSAMDMLSMANALGVKDKFWVVGYSGGAMHVWAAVRYIPERLAGAAMFAPLGNPYEYGMTKEERSKTWEKWTTKRKLMYILARRSPSLLPYFYRRSFLSGKQGQLEKWLALSLGKKDKTLVEDPIFKEFWEKDMAESVRQQDTKPFVEEAVLQVSRWGFTLADLQVQKKHEGKGIISWFKSLYNHAEREWSGFLGPIHIWQGMDDRVVPPATTEFVRRVIPGATVHKLLGEGHFSYFCFCDECHRQVFSTLFGIPQGPLAKMPPEQEQEQELEEEDQSHQTSNEGFCEEISANCTEQD